jgi:hypothetical protein
VKAMINITELIEILKRIKEDEGDLDVFNGDEILQEDEITLESCCGVKVLSFALREVL